jgi:hypothetical protein
MSVRVKVFQQKARACEDERKKTRAVNDRKYPHQLQKIRPGIFSEACYSPDV